ncbi:hypothetical protein [Natronorubrum thiooxidans]|uniref:DUF7967 domain-containing protein n=1 Tax=Natronorubrum thiooxidans TaxID=308853 RepID=A0A1N7EIK0_9EURY|nr:hypothetical protein [Natronorubrum thiooxidans]SIR87906.1 hypothetical protein SAMN05421752_104140 [Natronorubrum thiooxidans]
MTATESETIEADRDGNKSDDDTRVWLVERTYSDDELNLIILVYATEDGSRYHRRERALTSFTGPARETKAGLCVSPDALGTVDDSTTRERYATEARRMAEQHDPDDNV